VSSPKVRVIIEDITPRIDCGRFPIKRTIGEPVVVEADVFTDGHDQVTALMMYRHDGATEWHKVPMKPIGNDRFRAEFTVQQLGSYQYSVSAWVDHLESWRRREGLDQPVRVPPSAHARLVGSLVVPWSRR